MSFLGRLTAGDNGDEGAAEPRIEALRANVACGKDTFREDCRDPAGRSIEDQVAGEYPIDRRYCRDGGLPRLIDTFGTNPGRVLPARQAAAILDLCLDPARLGATPVHQFVDTMFI